MDRFDVRWLRLAVAAGAIAGTALVSSTVVATDEPLPGDESVLIVPVNDPSTDPVPADPPSDGSIVETVPEVAPDDVVLEDGAVIEITFVESDGSQSGEPGSGTVDTLAPEGVSDDEPVVGTVLEAPASEPLAAPDAAALEPSDGSTDHEGGGTDHEGGGTDHEGGEGGSGGQGTPFLVTFEVVWYDSAGIEIVDLDRSLFELSASSQTGSGKPTSALCTYPDDSGVLHCEFANKGHGSESEGLIVPASKKATYTVSVVWPPEDWTIEGADDIGYSCRSDDHGGGGDDHGGGGDDHGGGGDDHEGGGTDHESGGTDHESGGTDHEGGGTDHEGGGSDAGAGRSTNPCVHTVVMRQLTVVVPPTEAPAPAPAPEVAPTPAAPAAIATPSEVVAAAPVAAVTPRALPATGSSISMLLVLAGLLVAVGSTAALVSRRTS